jgi:flagellar biosynthetic protein FlhB
MLLASVLVLHKFGLDLMMELKNMVWVMLSPEAGANPTRVGSLAQMPVSVGRSVVGALAPLVLGITAAGVAVSMAQVGFNPTTKPLQPNFGKLSPIRGLGNLLNLRGGIRLVMGLSKIAVIGGVAMWVIVQDLPGILVLSELEPMPMFGVACEMVYSLALKLAAVLITLALIDYLYQRWQHEKDLRMTKEEVKEELKRMEGDPLVKQRRMRVARQLAMQRIGQTVPKADVVVTNPTHYAVALRYDSKTMAAPKVVAKGADFMAMRIRQLAALHGIPIVERKELAQALYRGVDVGREVPGEFYGAVAEILAYVYRLSGKKTA